MAKLTPGTERPVDMLSPSVYMVMEVTDKTATSFTFVHSMGAVEEYVGVGFTYDPDGALIGGTITGCTTKFEGVVIYTLSGVSASTSGIWDWLRAGVGGEALRSSLAGDDQIVGGDFDDSLLGGAGDDTLEGRGGDDWLFGGEGNDVLDGGAGFDIAVLGFMGAYDIRRDGPNWIVAGIRGGDTNTLASIEEVNFDGWTILDLRRVDSATEVATHNILRTDTANVALLVGNDLRTAAEGIASLIRIADQTTTVATLSYQFFTGKIPSHGGVDYLVSPTGPNANNLNSAYYQSFNLENRYINFAVNLGKVGEGNAKFTAEYGSLSLFDATKKAYATIFGGTPTDAKVHLLIDSRVDYFASYGGDGATGIGTKAAMVGWLLAEAAKADVGMYSKANDAFLTDLADGATFAIDLVGVYGKAEYAYSG